LVLDVEKKTRRVFVAIRNDGAQEVVRADKVDDAEVSSDGVFDYGVWELNSSEVASSVDVYEVGFVPIVGVVGMKRGS
jgi:hypothetical protein